ncbi:hypothetical protein IE077_001856 [Cardiosporidium cionae]|uniref:GPI ethanolamine phosphate transferase 3 n=1 Tax=Cardiosporidium cionae TaxID=476202 RepID=A0ABQ7JC21_9APIC|nr:hypothetical protein IE077_001856 [Cardiosporidium cionae]|eukprot:KAF8821573.1 hypothetical protein IE077_001856 [Cardiosporidium cionae]
MVVGGLFLSIKITEISPHLTDASARTPFFTALTTPMTNSPAPTADVGMGSDSKVEDGMSVEENHVLPFPSSLNPLFSQSAPFKRIILVILDSFRFDFVLHNPATSFVENHLSGNEISQANEEVMNGFPIFHELLKKSPENSILFKVIADTPTLTFHRIKSLMTGSPAAFFDIGKIFTGDQQSGDNLLLQLQRHDHSSAIGGDDVWSQLFKNFVTYSRPYKGLDLHDFHTVDSGVYAFFEEFLDRSDWSFLVGHLLGIDKMSHSIGIQGAPFQKKLIEYHSFVSSLIQRFQTESQWNDTLLLVMGDHGQTNKGDHGGRSCEETNTFLFAYSPSPFGFSLLNLWDSIWESDQEAMDECTEAAYLNTISQPLLQEFTFRTLRQMDMTSTLAILLGLPLPYQNVGKLVYPLLPERWIQEMSECVKDLLLPWETTPPLSNPVEEEGNLHTSIKGNLTLSPSLSPRETSTVSTSTTSISLLYALAEIHYHTVAQVRQFLQAYATLRRQQPLEETSSIQNRLLELETNFTRMAMHFQVYRQTRQPHISSWEEGRPPSSLNEHIEGFPLKEAFLSYTKACRWFLVEILKESGCLLTFLLLILKETVATCRYTLHVRRSATTSRNTALDEGEAKVEGMPPMTKEGGMFPMTKEGGMPPMTKEGGMPPMTKEGGMPPMTKEGGMPPMTKEGGMPPTMTKDRKLNAAGGVASRGEITFGETQPLQTFWMTADRRVEGIPNEVNFSMEISSGKGGNAVARFAYGNAPRLHVICADASSSPTGKISRPEPPLSPKHVIIVGLNHLGVLLSVIFLRDSAVLWTVLAPRFLVDTVGLYILFGTVAAFLGVLCLLQRR